MHRDASTVETTESARARHTMVAGSRSIAPYAIAALIEGLVFVVVGAIVLLRADLTDGWTADEVTVAGLRHTPLLGVVWLALGLLLLIAGAARSRSFTMAMGVLMVAGGIVLIAEHDSLRDELAAEAGHGWILLIAGALLFLLAVAAPTVRRTSVVDVSAVDDVRDGWASR